MAHAYTHVCAHTHAPVCTHCISLLDLRAWHTHVHTHRRCIGCLGLPYQTSTTKVSETTEMDSLPVLESRSLRSRCRQGHTHPNGSRGGSLLACSSFRWWRAISSVPCLADTSPRSLPLSSYGQLLCVQISFSCLIKTLSLYLGSTLNPA